ncbi:hypothetical protein HNP93_000969 [Methanococcus maripaludis]|uniref:Uncharacterized protein n=1 Tax=Methanococcus maripaludis TaxID=39152 RepID=A0A7J9P6B4_METMI|nr:hypothetical protein [Methanococcus maripaludis]MBA2858268.1 hypothetical protein [Methanococcus maripaludis]
MNDIDKVKEFLEERKAKGIRITKVGEIMEHLGTEDADEAKKLAIAAGATPEKIPYMVGPNPKKIYFK